MAVKKVIPKQQAMLKIAGHLDSVTGEELSYAQAARKIGYAETTCRVAIHGATYAAFKKEWHARADKVRERRQKGAEKGAELAAKKRAFDVLEQARFWATFDSAKTGGRIQGQVNATRLVAEIEGRIIQKTQVTDLRGKSDDELEYIRIHKHIPTPEQLQEFVAGGGSGAGAGIEAPAEAEGEGSAG